MKYLPFLFTTVLWTSVDLTTKAMVSAESFKPFVLIKEFLSISYQKNSGIAFGVPVPKPIQISVAFILIGILMYFGFTLIKGKIRNPLGVQILFGIIIGGSIGNLINRIQLGYVVDLINLGSIPTFNFADVGITLGLSLLFLILLINKKI